MGTKVDTTFALLGIASVIPLHTAIEIRGSTGEETSQGECNCNLSVAQNYILFEVSYYMRTEALLLEPISTRPPYRSDAIYENICISYAVDKASKRSEYNSLHFSHP